MTEGEFLLSYNWILELSESLKGGKIISLIDEEGNTMCFADKLGELSFYIIDHHLYDKARKLIEYYDLFYDTHMYCSTDEASEEEKLMSKECDFSGCIAVIDNLEFWLKDSKEQEEHKGSGCHKKVDACFRNIIQYENKDQLLERLHSLIDGKSGADVGTVFLKARQDGFLTRNPGRSEFESEFRLIGSWTAITNYMSDNNQCALDRANRIIIFP